MNGDASGGGREVAFRSGDASVRGVLFETGAREPGPALVLIPDVHGVSALYREIGGAFAAAGLHTLVLDLYSREGAPRLTSLEAVREWIADLPDARVLADVEAATAHLASHEGVRADAIGVVGFCLGGQYALMAASRQSNLAATVAFYGMLRHGRTSAQKLPAPIDTAHEIRCPVLGLFGAEDPLIPATDVDALRSTLESDHRTFEIHVFPGAGHAFMNDRRPEAHRPEIARQAMRLAIDFLRANLARQEKSHGPDRRRATRGSGPRRTVYLI